MNRMKQLREERNLTMREASQRLGIPYTTYVNYEKGLREPNSEMLIRIANFFNTSIDYLLKRSDNREVLEIKNSTLAASGSNDYSGETNAINESGLHENDTAPYIEDDSEEFIILNRAAKKMTPENRKKLLEMIKIMFAEDFKEDE